MKTTITLKETTTTTREIAVSLPLFTKVVTDYFIDYYAIYDAENTQKNMNFTLLKATEKLFKLNCFAGINNAIDGENISQSEFIQAYNEAKKTINICPSFPNVTNDTQGEYYLTDEQKADLGSTAGEQTDDFNYIEFSKNN
jgi:hypothetical protein